ncbi:MAG: DNA repair protein RadA, partial [Clostridia bacterium]|nr:DNA repair protein RadA [Clostridia bacterium]
MKEKTIFFCTECGYESAKWMGKCPGCNSWNTMVEQRVTKTTKVFSDTAPKSTPKKIKEIEVTSEERFTTGIGEFDRVLGGGIVKGSLVLIGGAPGIGKSTISLQMCKTIDTDKKILYVSAEESQSQIKLRANRLGIENDNLLLYAETNMQDIETTIYETNPSVVIIDSVQTVYSPALTSASGSVSQVREITMTLMRIAKENNISIFLVGHITKDGALAGPKVLEHMVDCVLYFEGDRNTSYRLLRAAKNRFGST